MAPKEMIPCCYATSSIAYLILLMNVELSNNSIKRFVELKMMFVKRFVSASKKLNIIDLIHENREDETVTKYITRWTNLSMQ